MGDLLCVHEASRPPRDRKVLGADCCMRGYSVPHGGVGVGGVLEGVGLGGVAQVLVQEGAHIGLMHGQGRQRLLLQGARWLQLDKLP